MLPWLFVLFQDPVTNQRDWYYPYKLKAWKLFLSSMSLLFMVGHSFVVFFIFSCNTFLRTVSVERALPNLFTNILYIESLPKLSFNINFYETS